MYAFLPVPQISLEALVGKCRYSSGNPILAQQALVSPTVRAQVPGPSASTCQARSPLAGHVDTSVSCMPPPDGLVLKRERLVALGCSSGIVSTLMSARRASMNSVQ